MDYSLNEDQEALVSAVQSILRDRYELPQSARLSYQYYDEELQQLLDEGGFLDAGRELSPLEAALIVIEVARIPAVVEAATSSLVAPAILPDERLPGPIAIVDRKTLAKAHRHLSIAKTALVVDEKSVVVLPVSPGDVESVETIFGYPYGRFTSEPDLSKGRVLDAEAAARLRQWWRVAIACEMAGAAQAAIDFTVEYVKERHVFGKPVGSFQAVQHRLVQCHQIARGLHWLSLRAAWSGDVQDANLAVCYGQQHVQKWMFDLHQFNGAMGVTNEHLLHFWTYRLRALQSEAGGAYTAGIDIADRYWGSAAANE